MPFSLLDAIDPKYRNKLSLPEKAYDNELFETLNNKYNVTPEIFEEMEQIKREAIEWWYLLQAPNWKPSNLDERLWLLVRTKNFKMWFWDWENEKDLSSKVVDENWEPKIMYHWTNRRHISEFRINTQKRNGMKDWVYFTSYKKKAKEYTLNWMIYECFLNIKNPLIIDFEWKAWSNFSFQDAPRLFNKTEEEIKRIQKPYYKTSGIEDIVNTLKSFFWKFERDDTKRNYAVDQIVKITRQLWYDWIIAKNVKDIWKAPSLSRKTRNLLHDQVVVLDPNQIKDINNVWTFSKNSNNTNK